MMRKFCVIVVCLFLCPSFSKAVEFYQVEDYVLQALNSFRADPISYEKKLEVSDKVVREVWGNYYELLVEGFHPLKLDEKLNQAARAKIIDMLQKGYFSVVSPDGIGPDELIKQYNEEVLMAGLSMVYIAFEHLIPIDKALSYMLTFLEKKSLLMQNRMYSSILYPAYSNVGVALASIELETENGEMNVYVLCLVFAVASNEQNAEVFVVGKSGASCSFYFTDFTGKNYYPLVFPNGEYYISMPVGMNLLIVNTRSFLLPLAHPARVDIYENAEQCTIDFKY